MAAHITAAAPGGPRHDSALSPAQRRHSDNGLWLCQNCGHIVDHDEIQFPAGTLRVWRHVAETEASEALGKTAASGSPSPPPPAPQTTARVFLHTDGSGISPSNKSYNIINLGDEVFTLSVEPISGVCFNVSPQSNVPHGERLRLTVESTDSSALPELRVVLCLLDAHYCPRRFIFQIPVDSTYPQALPEGA